MSDDIQPERCGSCYYWQQPTSRMVRGYCLRYPVSVAKMFDEWCGEFAPRDGAPPAMIPIRANPGEAAPGEPTSQAAESGLAEMPGWDPLAHLPAGRVATTEIVAGLGAAFAANGYRPLTTAQIEAVCGPPLPFPASAPKPAALWPAP